MLGNPRRSCSYLGRLAAVHCRGLNMGHMFRIQSIEQYAYSLASVAFMVELAYLNSMSKG